MILALSPAELLKKVRKLLIDRVTYGFEPEDQDYQAYEKAIDRELEESSPINDAPTVVIDVHQGIATVVAAYNGPVQVVILDRDTTEQCDPDDVQGLVSVRQLGQLFEAGE